MMFLSPAESERDASSAELLALALEWVELTCHGGPAREALASYDTLAGLCGWVEVECEPWPVFRPSAFFWWLSTRYPEVLEMPRDELPACLVGARTVYAAELQAKPYAERN